METINDFLFVSNRQAAESGLKMEWMPGTPPHLASASRHPDPIETEGEASVERSILSTACLDASNLLDHDVG